MGQRACRLRSSTQLEGASTLPPEPGFARREPHTDKGKGLETTAAGS
jgi:hypothetical protein